MDLSKLNKNELITKCKELNITKYSSKNKSELIKLIEDKNLNVDVESINVNKKKYKNENENENKNVDANIDKNIDLESNIESIKKETPKKCNIDIQNIDGIKYLSTIKNNSVDLILTDPPYIISKESGMNDHYNNVKSNQENNIEFIKTEDEWDIYKNENNIEDDEKKNNYMKYGTIYGKKYCVKTDYGSWDNDFTIETLDAYINEYYNKLRKGGTMIIFFDIWKISILKDIMEKYKFKQIRFIEWIKTNPQPRNSKVNYLTNCREIALLGVKDGLPTFNSSYDNGIYNFPLQGGKNRFHPTQKSLLLFEELIKKHSNKGDVVLDTFLGSGTTALACINTDRQFKGCEIDVEYYKKINEILCSSSKDFSSNDKSTTETTTIETTTNDTIKTETTTNDPTTNDATIDTTEIV
jgi:site-specific DNA-methyltransferase (adenine-specific)